VLFSSNGAGPAVAQVLGAGHGMNRVRASYYSSPKENEGMEDVTIPSQAELYGNYPIPSR